MSRFAQQMTFLSDTEVEPDTLKWMEALKETLRPVHLARDTPRVANKIALLWSEPVLMRKYFDDLTLEEGGERKGFSPEVMLEIECLRHAFDTLHPAPADPWYQGTRLPESVE